MTTSTYRVVVLDCPYDTWSSATTQHLFSEIINLKLEGYKTVYSDGVLPIDTYDFIATHILVCSDDGGKLKPLTGFKSVTSPRCKRFNLPFPTSQLLSLDGAPLHAEAVATIMKNTEESGSVLAYDGAWTIDPEARKNRSVRSLLHELFISNVVHWHTSSTPHNLVGMGVPGIRTDKFFERVGFKRVTSEGKPLPTFNHTAIVGGEVALIYLEKFSEFATELARKYQPFWNNRITI